MRHGRNDLKRGHHGLLTERRVVAGKFLGVFRAFRRRLLPHHPKPGADGVAIEGDHAIVGQVSDVGEGQHTVNVLSTAKLPAQRNDVSTLPSFLHEFRAGSQVRRVKVGDLGTVGAGYRHGRNRGIPRRHHNRRVLPRLRLAFRQFTYLIRFSRSQRRLPAGNQVNGCIGIQLSSTCHCLINGGHRLVRHILARELLQPIPGEGVAHHGNAIGGVDTRVLHQQHCGCAEPPHLIGDLPSVGAGIHQHRRTHRHAYRRPAQLRRPAHVGDNDGVGMVEKLLRRTDAGIVHILNDMRFLRLASRRPESTTSLLGTRIRAVTGGLPRL